MDLPTHPIRPRCNVPSKANRNLKLLYKLTHTVSAVDIFCVFPGCSAYKSSQGDKRGRTFSYRAHFTNHASLKPGQCADTASTPTARCSLSLCFTDTDFTRVVLVTKQNKDKWRNYKNFCRTGVILWSALLLPDLLLIACQKEQISSGSTSCTAG